MGNSLLFLLATCMLLLYGCIILEICSPFNSFWQANIGNVHTLQWCKFVADQLHEELSKGTVTQACLLHLQVYMCFYQIFIIFEFLNLYRFCT